MTEIVSQFDDVGARKIAAICLTPDVAAQRARVVEALAMLLQEARLSAGSLARYPRARRSACRS